MYKKYVNISSICEHDDQVGFMNHIFSIKKEVHNFLMLNNITVSCNHFDLVKLAYLFDTDFSNDKIELIFHNKEDMILFLMNFN
jgi:hypothetical protein